MSTCSKPAPVNKTGRNQILSTYRRWKDGQMRGQRASVGLAEKLPALCSQIDSLIEERKALRSAIVKAVNNQTDATHALRMAYNQIPPGVRKNLA